MSARNPSPGKTTSEASLARIYSASDSAEIESTCNQWVSDCDNDLAGFDDKFDDIASSGRWRGVFESGHFRPMPCSASEGDLTARACVFEVL